MDDQYKSTMLAQLDEQLTDSLKYENLAVKDSAALKLGDKARLNAATALPDMPGYRTDTLYGTNANAVERLMEQKAMGQAYAITRGQNLRSSKIAEAKDKQITAGLEQLNNAYKARGRRGQSASIKNREAYTKQFARQMLGMGKDLYN